MGHSGTIASTIQNYEQRKRVEAVVDSPLPKLGFDYVPIQDIEMNMHIQLGDKQKFALAWEGVDPTYYGARREMAEKDMERKRAGDKGEGESGELNPFDACKVQVMRVFNLNEAGKRKIRQEDFVEDGKLNEAEWNKAKMRLDARAEEMCADLNKMGCRALVHYHQYPRKTGEYIADKRDKETGTPLSYKAATMEDTQICLALPCTYPHPLDEGESYHCMDRDTKGADLFIAYLLATRMVSPKEVADSYGVTFLEGACRQNEALKKIGHAIGEHVMDEAQRLIDAPRPGVMGHGANPNRK